MQKEKFILCPVCGNKTRVQIREDDDAVIRQILQCVIVESKEKIKVVFIGGMEVETEVEQ